LDGVEGCNAASKGHPLVKRRVFRRYDEGSNSKGARDMNERKSVSVADISEAMKDVIDPELGINVVDLGLIYDMTLEPDNVAVLDMTLTSAACPLQDVIEDQTREALSQLVNDVRINWVWMPPWGPNRITDDGREQLRAIGFTV
jgi:metal-sulfur cluster biosynthetic enzyme